MNKQEKLQKYYKYVEDKLKKGLCIQCGKKAVTARHCEFHRDQQKKYNLAYQLNNKKKIAERRKLAPRKFTQEQLERMRAYSKIWHQKNKEHVLERQRAYRKRKREEQLKEQS